MPASPARIGLITNEYRRVIAGPDAQVEARFGSAARADTEPVESLLAETADAQAMANARLAILSRTARYLVWPVMDAKAVLDMDTGNTVPVAHCIDDERQIDRGMVVSRYAIDTNDGTAVVETWG